MRPCPYCANDIQDEAIVCRYCGLDVKRPEWLRNKVRCDYCAEWISPNQELCPYCKSDLTEAPPAEEPAAEPMESNPPSPEMEAPEPAPVGASSVRRQSSPPPLRREPPEEVEPAEAEAAAMTDSASGTGPLRTAPFDTSPQPEREPDDTSQPFRSPYLERELLEGLDEDPLSAKRVEEEPRLEIDFGKLLQSESFARGARWFLIGLVGLGVLSGVIYLAVRFGGEIPVAALSPFTPTPTDLPTARPTAATLPTSEPTLDATESTIAPGCVDWTEITEANIGETRCVYGTVKRWFSSGDLAFVAIFSEESGTFALVDRTLAHPEISPGECIRGEGEIELMSATRPFIDLHGVVLDCN